MNILIRTLLVSSILVPLAQAADLPAASASAPSAASAPVSASSPATAASAPATAPNQSTAAAIPSKEDAVKAIAVLENSFLGLEAPAAAQSIMLFAENSKQVSVQLSLKTTPWIFGKAKDSKAEEENYRRMLLVAYLAGNMKSQFAAGKPIDNPQAGWEFALKAYQTIKQDNNKIKIPELETLQLQQSKGQLPALAKKALKK
ncbi:MAG: hypothetical protein P4L87_15015 [Formivibrio sp.]|nr:hypothetical protein [Formivibrio sp.]